jgi:hypothetical protein
MEMFPKTIPEKLLQNRVQMKINTPETSRVLYINPLDK